MANEIIHPGIVELKLEELTKEQLIEQVRRLQYMLEHRPDRELRMKLERLETECYNNGWVLDNICNQLHYRGYNTPDLLSIHKVVARAFYDRERVISGDAESLPPRELP